MIILHPEMNTQNRTISLATNSSDLETKINLVKLKLECLIQRKYLGKAILQIVLSTIYSFIDILWAQILK